MKHVVHILMSIALAAILAGGLHAAQFTLTWADNSTNESGFVIERAPGLAATSGFAVIAQVGANVTTYVDKDLPSATAYTYRVFAWNAAGRSGYSNTASGTTLPPVPAAPGAPSLDGGPAYVPPPVTVTATFTVQGAQLLAANIAATPAE